MAIWQGSVTGQGSVVRPCLRPGPALSARPSSDMFDKNRARCDMMLERLIGFMARVDCAAGEGPSAGHGLWMALFLCPAFGGFCTTLGGLCHTGMLAPGPDAEMMWAGRGRAGHVVLVGPVPVLGVRVAARHAGPGALLPDLAAGDRPRHPLLLGRAHGDDGHEAHWCAPALRGCLHVVLAV